MSLHYVYLCLNSDLLVCFKICFNSTSIQERICSSNPCSENVKTRSESAASEFPFHICHFQITAAYLVLCILVYSKVSLSNMQQQCLQRGISGGGRWHPPSCLSLFAISKLHPPILYYALRFILRSL